jgi:hypothetical protein
MRDAGCDGAFRLQAEVPHHRSSASLVAHVANTQYTFCTPVRKVENPNKGNLEKTATTKVALVAAIKDAFAYCDPAYEITDAGLNEMVGALRQPGHLHAPQGAHAAFERAPVTLPTADWRLPIGVAIVDCRFR